MIRSELVQKLASENPDLAVRDVEAIVGTFFDEIVKPALAKVEKVDDYTVKLTLKKPNSPLLSALSVEPMSILSAEYAAAMSKAGALPSRTAMIGDTRHDMAMARAAGVAAIGVAWGYHPEVDLRAAGADIVIDRFDELDAALDQLLGP